MAGNPCGGHRSQHNKDWPKLDPSKMEEKLVRETPKAYVIVIMKTNTTRTRRAMGDEHQDTSGKDHVRNKATPNQEAQTEFGTTKFRNWKHKIPRTN